MTMIAVMSSRHEDPFEYELRAHAYRTGTTILGARARWQETHRQQYGVNRRAGTIERTCRAMEVD
jgi:hypothetical protein